MFYLTPTQLFASDMPEYLRKAYFGPTFSQTSDGYNGTNYITSGGLFYSIGKSLIGARSELALARVDQLEATLAAYVADYRPTGSGVARFVSATQTGTGHAGTEADPWALAELNASKYSSLPAGSVLYFIGDFTQNSYIPVFPHNGTSGAPVVLNGYYKGQFARFKFDFDGSYMYSVANNTVFANLIFERADGRARICLVIDKQSGTIQNVTVDGCKFYGNKAASAGTMFAGDATTFTNVTFKNCEFHDIGAAQTSGEVHGIVLYHTASSVTLSNITVENCLFNNVGSDRTTAARYGVRFWVDAGAASTSRFNNVTIRRNVFTNCKANTIIVHQALASTSWPSAENSLWSDNITIEDNVILNCGVHALTGYGLSGGITVIGYGENLNIRYNYLDGVTGNGGAIATSHGKYRPSGGILGPTTTAKIYGNVIRDIHSGTGAVGFHSGYPIDGSGIFLDTFSVGMEIYGNLIEKTNVVPRDPHAHHANAIQLYMTRNVKVYNNICVDCARGPNLGSDAMFASHTLDNEIYHNAFHITSNVGGQLYVIMSMGGTGTTNRVRDNLFMRF